ncbi:MAG: zinc-dependent metalloprotease [Persicimonas sp.]
MRNIGGWPKAVCLFVSVITCAALASGCAQDVEDIDRTQADKIEKDLFENDDEWYFRQTVVDTGTEGSSMIFEAYEGPLHRIRWEIEHGTLYAYSTVPLADGIEDRNSSEEDRRLGAVAAFDITDHFDVIRQYNATTGEQSNVIVEDRNDRPWYERDYMRVNWSANTIEGLDLFRFGMLSGVETTINQDREFVEPDRARITEDYIDVTTEYNFEPDIYACVLNVGSLDTMSSCAGSRVRVRNSFVRVPKEKTYEPFEMTDTKDIVEDDGSAVYTTSIQDPVSRQYMEVECNDHTKDFLREEYGSTDEQCSTASFGLFDRFGYFRTERMAWNERRPGTESDRRYYANRWNIWQTAYDEDGERLDLKDRTPKPIVYHLNAEYPKDMIPAAKEVERQWDEAFLDTVRIAKGYDSIQEVRDELAAEYDGDTRMYKIEPNNCMPEQLASWKSEFGDQRDADRSSVDGIFDKHLSSPSNLVGALWDMPTEDRIQLCAELEYATETRSDADARFTWQRVGDLRYSFFNWVEEFNGYWSGYGPSAADPLSGEIISGNANFAGTPLRSYATRGTDTVQYITGELSDSDIRLGDHVREYLHDLRDGRRTQALDPEMPAEGQRELTRRAGHQPSSVSPTDFEEPPRFEDQDNFFKRWGDDRLPREADRLSEAITEAKASDTRVVEFYEKPRVKQFMLSDADFQLSVKALANETFGPDPSDDEMHQAYLELATPKDVLKRNNRFNRFLSEQNIFATENLDRALSSLVTYEGVAGAFEGMDREQIRRYLMDNAFIGTQLHEVGHTIGLRHNFSASMDALNYHDGFWQIKQDVLEGELQDGNGVEISERGAVHITDPELASQYSNQDNVDYVSTTEMRLGSIMDYTGDMTGRFAGLGKYDKAAINFAYGEHVQQWKEDIELPNMLWYEQWVRDYTALPSIYGNDPTSMDAETQRQGIDVMLNQREWVSISDALDERREGIKANTTAWADGEIGLDNQPYVDRTVPYEFCSDDYRDSRLGCDVFDWGANQTEVVNHAFDQYRFFQPFWRYAGHQNDRLMNTYSNYINRVMSTFQIAERPFRYYSIYQWWDLGSYTDDLQRASMDSLNFYAEVLATPQPGTYCMYGSGAVQDNSGWFFNLNNKYIPNGWLTDGTTCANSFEVERGQGQYYGFDFTDEYHYRIKRVGAYVDKSLATQALFDISANYAFSSFFTDQRASNISYWTLFEDELNDYLRGVILGDYAGFSGVYDRNTQSYEPPVVVDPKTFATGLDHPQDNMERVYSQVGLNEQFNALAFGMLYNSTWQDRSTDFSNYVKVAVTNEELQPLADWVEVAELEHPTTGQVYYAPQTADGKSISYDLVEWANNLKDAMLEAQEDLAQAEPDTEAYENAWDEASLAERQFEDVVAKLEMIRFVFDAGGINR